MSFPKDYDYLIPGIPTTIKTMGVNITTIVYLRVLIIEIGSTSILMVVEAQGNVLWTPPGVSSKSPFLLNAGTSGCRVSLGRSVHG